LRELLGQAIASLKARYERGRELREFVLTIAVLCSLLSVGYALVRSFIAHEPLAGYFLNSLAAIVGVVWIVAQYVFVVVTIVAGYAAFIVIRSLFVPKDQLFLNGPRYFERASKFLGWYVPGVTAVLLASLVFVGLEKGLFVAVRAAGLLPRLKALMPGLFLQ
jgi:hypothetical protein